VGGGFPHRPYHCCRARLKGGDGKRCPRPDSLPGRRAVVSLDNPFDMPGPAATMSAMKSDPSAMKEMSVSPNALPANNRILPLTQDGCV
jgi:hypothetical protein